MRLPQFKQFEDDIAACLKSASDPMSERQIANKLNISTYTAKKCLRELRLSRQAHVAYVEPMHGTKMYAYGTKRRIYEMPVVELPQVRIDPLLSMLMGAAA